jgi:hypothetical protein
MQEGAWYRLVIALVTALVVFSNQFFGTHISTADAVSVATAGIALILAEAAVLHGKGREPDFGLWTGFLDKASRLIKELQPPVPAPAPKTTAGIPQTTTTSATAATPEVAPPAPAGTAADPTTGDKVAHDA